MKRRGTMIRRRRTKKIRALQKKADKLCEARGHKLKWRYEWANKTWFGYCKCSNYARICNDWWLPLIGTIFVSYARPVEVKEACWYAKNHAGYKRKYTWHKKAILKAYKDGGIEKAIIVAIGKYPD